MLSALRIVELGSHIAAPATAGLLADWGADVIKIETRTGDPIRWQFTPAQQGGSSPNFELDNRGKRSIVLDYRLPKGRAILSRLLDDADVFITNLRPGSLKRAGLDYATLSAAYPRLIFTSITGYGFEGEAANNPAFDITAFWSRSGLAGQMLPAGQSPLNWRAGLGDHITALSAALATVTALYAREKTGVGQLVEASLLRAGTYVGGFDLADQLRRGETLPTLARADPDAAVSCYFPVADNRWICVWAHRPEADWPKIFAVAGRPDLIGNPLYATNEARRQNGAALTHELDEGFRSLTLGAVGLALDAADIVWSPLQTSAEVCADPLARAAGCFVEVADGEGASFLSPAPPARLHGGDAPKGPVPRLGEHTDMILAELGLSPVEIDDVRRSGALL